MNYYYNNPKRDLAEKAHKAALNLLTVAANKGKLEVNDYVEISTDYTRTGVWVRFELSWKLQGYNKYDKFRARRLKLVNEQIPTKKFIAKYKEVAKEAVERKEAKDKRANNLRSANQLIKDLKLYSKYDKEDSVKSELGDMPKGGWYAPWGDGLSILTNDNGSVKVGLTLNRSFKTKAEGQSVIDQVRAIFETLEEMKA